MKIATATIFLTVLSNNASLGHAAKKTQQLRRRAGGPAKEAALPPRGLSSATTMTYFEGQLSTGCRSDMDGSRGTQGVDYVLGNRDTRESLAACQEECLARPRCKGVEFKKNSRCELWKHDILDMEPVSTGHECYRKVTAPVVEPPTTPPPVVDPEGTAEEIANLFEGLPNTGCRADMDGFRGTQGVDYVLGNRDTRESLAACQEECLFQDECVGVEFKKGRCELWKHAIVEMEPVTTGHECYRRKETSVVEPPITPPPVVEQAPMLTFEGSAKAYCCGSGDKNCDGTIDPTLYDKISTGYDSGEECKDLCADREDCTGFEFRASEAGATCHLWKEEIAYLKPPQSEWDWAPQCYKKVVVA